MTTSAYAEKIIRLIEKRPPQINPDKLLYEVYVKWKVAEGLRAVEQGKVHTHEQVREAMWEIVNSKSSGARRQNKISKASSAKSRKARR